MKKILIVCAGIAMFFLQSCYEDYKSDFEYSSTYFALQAPLRTLVVEEGKDLSLEVGVVLTGKYSNDQDEIVDFEMPATMLDSTGLTLLPASHYNITSTDQFVIEKGGILGTVKITLTDAFINDPMAHKVHYALPFKITGSTTDSINTEKDSTILAIRYHNKYYGAYWLKGVTSSSDETGGRVEKTTYSNPDLVDNISTIFSTLSKDSSLVKYVGANVSGANTMKLAIQDNGAVTIVDSENSASSFDVTGTGNYDADKKMFTLDYTYADTVFLYENPDNDKEITDTLFTHHATDTLYHFDVPLSLEQWTDDGIVIE